jgi:hypothetical protein
MKTPTLTITITRAVGANTTRAVFVSILLSCLHCIEQCAGQTLPSPSVEWVYTFGGTSAEGIRSVKQTSDGGFVLGGFSYSGASGSKTATNYGQCDFWVVRLSRSGQKLWDKAYGSTTNDFLNSLCETSDGGFLLGGSSRNGIGGSKTSPRFGDEDYWIVRLDRDGNQLWDQSFGGMGDDRLYSLLQTTDGGFVLAGRSRSGISANKSAPNLGLEDFWIIRLNAQGSPLWDRTYGTANYDYLNCIRQTSDGGFIIAGQSGGGGLIVRTDPNGEPVWSRSCRGIVTALVQSVDGGFFAGGFVDSPVPDPSSTNQLGRGDWWLLQLQPDGFPVWEKTLGTTNYEVISDVAQASDGGFYLAGSLYAWATGKNVGRVVRVDNAGNELWQQSFPSESGIGIEAIDRTSDGGLLLGGIAGDVGSDYWVAKLGPEPPRLRVDQQVLTGFPRSGFRFFLTGVSNRYLVEYAEHASNALTWNPLTTIVVPVTGAEVEVLDMGATNASFRLYRVKGDVPNRIVASRQPQ